MRIGVDLGGTNLRLGLVENGEVIKKISLPSPANKMSYEQSIEYLKDSVECLIKPKVDGIGIGVPSIVDTEKGIVYDVVNISSWREVHLKKILEELLHIPVFVNNDCNCFVLGEHLYGPGRKYSHLAGVTLGTGLGMGLILNGELYEGNNGGAGEIGCLPYLDQNLEYYCSANFFAGKDTTGKIASGQAGEGDEKALALWAEFGMHVGNMILSVMYSYDPQAIVLGGGLAASFRLFEPAMRETMRNYAYKRALDRIYIYVSHLADAGILGASSLTK